jgi:hypothetical protein
VNALYCLHEGCAARPVRDTSFCEKHQVRVDPSPPGSLDETLTWYFEIVDALDGKRPRGRR